MKKEILTYADAGIDKRKFRCYKDQILIDVDISKILISNKVSFGKKYGKYFSGYKNDDYKIKPLCIQFAKMSEYVKNFD